MVLAPSTSWSLEPGPLCPAGLLSRASPATPSPECLPLFSLAYFGPHWPLLNPSINALPLHKTHSHGEIFSSSYLMSKTHKSAPTLITVPSRRPARPAHSLFSSHTDGDRVCVAHIGVCYGMSETRGCLGGGVWRGLHSGTQPIRGGRGGVGGHSGGAPGKVHRLRRLVRGQGHTRRGVWAAGEAPGSVASIRYCVTFAR